MLMYHSHGYYGYGDLQGSIFRSKNSPKTHLCSHFLSSHLPGRTGPLRFFALHGRQPGETCIQIPAHRLLTNKSGKTKWEWNGWRGAFSAHEVLNWGDTSKRWILNFVFSVEFFKQVRMDGFAMCFPNLLLVEGFALHLWLIAAQDPGKGFF